MSSESCGLNPSHPGGGIGFEDGYLWPAPTAPASLFIMPSMPGVTLQAGICVCFVSPCVCWWSATTALINQRFLFHGFQRYDNG